MTEDKEVTAVFSKAGCPAQTVNHTLIVEASGEGTVSPKAGRHKFEENEEVSLQAEPADGWSFFHWIVEDETETKEYNEQNISIKMTGRVKATAVFAKPFTPPTSYRIKVDREGEGIITPWKGTRFLRRNEVVNLQAEPARGWEFKEWLIKDEDGTSQLFDENISFKMERDIDVTAVFVKALAPTSYTLTVNVEGEGTVTPAIGTHEFLENEQAEQKGESLKDFISHSRGSSRWNQKEETPALPGRGLISIEACKIEPVAPRDIGIIFAVHNDQQVVVIAAFFDQPGIDGLKIS